MTAIPSSISPFPPTTQIYLLRKGSHVKDPSVGLSVRQLNALLQNSQGHADDLSTPNSQVSGQLVQDQLVLFREPDRSFPGSSLHSSSKNAARDCTEALQQAPKNSLSGVPKLVTKVYEESEVASTPRTSDPVALEWLLNPDKTDAVFDRILARLVQSEAHEENPHLRDDYRIAWLTVRFCQTGECNFEQPDGSIKKYPPHVWATVRVLGCHPDQVWFRMQQRKQALLGQPIRIGAVRSTQAACGSRESAGAAALPPQRKESAPVTKFKKETA